jgi:hypothetical protein
MLHALEDSLSFRGQRLLSSPSAQPRLSVVVTSRNDDHGGNLLERSQLFVNSLMAQCGKQGLTCELILVEWNPPPGRPGLAESLDWSKCNMFHQARIIQVPPEIHRRCQHSSKLPLFQMLAKNVGIRRARADWVLCTNVDVLLSPALVSFLALGQLLDNSVYRVDRWDVPGDIPLDLTQNELFALCKAKRLRSYNRWGTRETRLGARNQLDWLFYSLKWWLAKCRLRIKRRPLLHTNACGDFTLMARQHWNQLRGYPEFEIYSMNLDSLLLCAAVQLGLTEQYLAWPMSVFHLDHTPGSGWVPGKGAELLYQKISQAQIPWLSWEECCQRMDSMTANRRPESWNNPDWGLAGEGLTELLIC